MVRHWRGAMGIAVALLGTSQSLAQPAPNAHPTGGVVAAGAAGISYNATTTTIDQSTPRAAINWQSFDIGSRQAVRFNQPSTNAVTLNRVVGPDPSQIAGRIDANGQIIIVNQSGVTFFQGAQVNTSGLMVTAAGIHDADFMSGSMNFNQPAAPNARVVNDGTITIANAGLAALVAPSVANSGTISAKMGHVVLAGARTATLDLFGDGLISLDVTNQVTQAPSGATALVTNTGVIRADGGTVQLTARAADGVVGRLVQSGGTIEANNGTVVLNGIGGSIVVEGQLSAAAGNIEVAPTGNVAIAATARISASGNQGGGVVAIGTTLARAKGGPAVTPTRVSANVTIAPGAVIAADATKRGDGGRIVLLSTGITSMAGSLSARGGPDGGNGGFVEVSGGLLALTGHVDTTAPRGTIGTLLLDPFDLYISDVQPAIATYTVLPGDLPTIGPTQAPDGSTVSWLSTAILNGQAADVTLSTTNDIFVATSFGTTNALNRVLFQLTLNAGRNLTIDRGFTINSSVLTLTATTGNITLGGSSGVQAGLITAGQLALLAPTSLRGMPGSAIIMTAGSGISLADSTLGAVGAVLSGLNLTTAAGGVTQSPNGAIFSNQVVSGGGVVGTFSLPSTSNAIGLVDHITVSGGDLTVVNGQNMSIGDTLSANNLFFEVARPGGVLTLGFPTRNLPVPATLTAGAGGRITLVADAYINTIAGSTLTTSGGAVELAPYSPANTSLFGSTGLVVSPAFLAIIQTNGGTLDLGGFTNVLIGATTPSASAASVTIDGAANLTGIATTLRLDATGAITQPGGSIVVGNVIANGGSVTLTNAGNAFTSASGSAAGAFSLTDGSALALGNVAAGSAETILAPVLTIPGTQQAPLLSLTATKGGITGTGSLVVGTLTGSSVGATQLIGANQLATLGNFSASGFALADGTNLTIAGTLTAPTISIQAPTSQVVLGDGASIVTAGMVRPPGPIQPSFQPSNGALGATIAAASFVQVGVSSVVGIGGRPATLQIATAGNIRFDSTGGLSATGTSLILGLPRGTATGNVFVKALDVLFGTPGSANLFGTIDGISGGIAAASGHIRPNINVAYLFNNCVIGSTVCSNPALIGSPPFLPGTPSSFVPLPTLVPLGFLMLPEQPGDLVDPDVVPPNISFVDY